MVGGAFRRKADAESLARWLKRDQVIDAKIMYIESDEPFVPSSNLKSPPPYKTSSTPANNGDFQHFEKLQTEYNKAMYKSLLNDKKNINLL